MQEKPWAVGGREGGRERRGTDVKYLGHEAHKGHTSFHFYSPAINGCRFFFARLNGHETKSTLAHHAHAHSNSTVVCVWEMSHAHWAQITAYSLPPSHPGK